MQSLDQAHGLDFGKKAGPALLPVNKSSYTARGGNGMDELDHKIVSLLQLDARTAYSKISRELSVSEATVRKRMRRLVQEDVVSFMAVPNLERMGYTASALIGLRTAPGKSDSVAEAIADLNEVLYVTITTGAYDVFIWVALESVESLGAFLRTKIGVIEGIQRAEPFVNLAIKKRTYGPVL